MAFTQRSGFPTSNDGAALTSLTVSPVTIGDLLIFAVASFTGFGGTITMGGTAVTTWHQAIATTTIEHQALAIVWGSVVATGSQTVTCSYANSGSDFQTLVADSYGFSGTVALQGADESHQATSAIPANWPSITSSSGSGDLYWGYGAVNPLSAPTSGFTTFEDVGGDWAIYDASLAASTAYAPTATQSSAATYDTVGAIFTTTAPSPPPHNLFHPFMLPTVSLLSVPISISPPVIS